MKKFFSQDKVIVGLVASIGSELLFCLLLTIGLLLIGISPTDKLRLYAGMFIPTILILRHYAKPANYPKNTKTIIIVFALTFIPFVSYLIHTNQL